MKKTIVVLFLLTSLFSCTNPEKDLELKRSYEATIKILLYQIKNNGEDMESIYTYQPIKTESYYTQWKIIDSLTSNVKLVLNTELSNRESLNFYRTINKNFKDEFNEQIVGWRLAKHMRYLDDKEIASSSQPKLLAISALLSNFYIISSNLVSSVSAPDCSYGISWEAEGVYKNDTAKLFISSGDFYYKAKNGFFKFNRVADSYNRVVKKFDKKSSNVICTISIPGYTDTVCYVSGSIFSERPDWEKRTFELDTFINRKVNIVRAQ